MAETQLSTYFWREHATQRYQEIRRLQATKLLPVQQCLAARQFEKLEGSLISAEQLHNPTNDSPIYLQKRLNYVMLLDQLQCKSMLEIGFNWGYSASLLLESAPGTLHSIDIGWHWYTPPTGDLIAEIYPDRFRYTWRDSHEALAVELQAGRRYDMISVDGGHDYTIARNDILLSVELLQLGGLLIVDDTDGPSVAAAVLATVADHPEMIELTAQNFGLFEFGQSEIPCFEQRYFLKRVPLRLGATLDTAPQPPTKPGLLRRAAGKLKRLIR